MAEIPQSPQSTQPQKLSTQAAGESPTKTAALESPKVTIPDNAIGFMLFYNMIFQARGITLSEHLIPVALAATDYRIKNLLIVVGPGAGKSLLLSVAFNAFQLGQDPSTTILSLSAGENLPQGFMLGVMDIIDRNPTWKVCFPSVSPLKEKGWSTERGLFVTGHPDGDPDASFFAAGMGSKALTGKHGRLINADDLHDKENSASAEACLRVRETYYKQIIGRADPRGARFMFAGRRWHTEDIYGHLMSTGDWVVMELPAIREKSKELWWDIHIPDGLVCCFNDPNAPDRLGGGGGDGTGGGKSPPPQIADTEKVAKAVRKNAKIMVGGGIFNQ